MKKLFIWLVGVIFIVSLTFMGAGCKGALEEVVTEAIEEAVEEVEEAVEEAEEVEEAAPAEEEPEAVTEIEEFVVALTADCDTLDWFISGGVEALKMKQMCHNGLVALDKDFNVVPSLAKDWDVSDDGLVYTFYLEEGVKFHNGEEFTADHVKLTYDAYLDPDNAYKYNGDFNMIDTVEVLDDYTVKITLSKAYAPFLAGIASGVKPILCEDSFREDEDGILRADGMVGTGPYKFVEWEPEDHFTVERFDDYWAGKPNVKKVVFKCVTEDIVRLSGLQAGDLDLIISPPQADVLAYLDSPEDGEWMIGKLDGTQAWMVCVTFNFNPDLDFPTKDNKKLRQAIQYALDTEAITQLVTKGLASNDHGGWPAANVWGSGVSDVKQDIEKAKQLLAEAGYPDGMDMVMCTTDLINMDKLAEMVQAQLAEIGINVEVQSNELAKFFDRENRVDDYDIKTTGHSVSVDPGPLWNLVLRGGSPANWWLGYYNTPEIDTMLDEAEVSTDVTERQALYKEIYEIIKEDAGAIWVWNEPVTYGILTKYQGLELNTRGDLIFGNNHGFPWITEVTE